MLNQEVFCVDIDALDSPFQLPESATLVHCLPPIAHAHILVSGSCGIFCGPVRCLSATVPDALSFRYTWRHSTMTFPPASSPSPRRRFPRWLLAILILGSLVTIA